MSNDLISKTNYEDQEKHTNRDMWMIYDILVQKFSWTWEQ